MRIRRLVPILGLAASLVSPASAQNPGALHWRQKTGLGVMLAGVVAIVLRTSATHPTRSDGCAGSAGSCRSRRRRGAAAGARASTARRGGGARRVDRRKDVVVGRRRPGPSA